ncbi:hypothetical protein AAFF_G00182870 [Aldrovandia affinis]|uniref:Uncharacterized protein n=1 Tax=Aldrovandia affinis TaxID=143900 RepID=A0AAD7VX18_9TELE|nr:hypothetical protein AAFF_G00182870 [Aldrovandia affinis]
MILVTLAATNRFYWTFVPDGVTTCAALHNASLPAGDPGARGRCQWCSGPTTVPGRNEQQGQERWRGRLPSGLAPVQPEQLLHHDYSYSRGIKSKMANSHAGG